MDVETTCPTLRKLLQKVGAKRVSEVVYAESVDWSYKDLRKQDASAVVELLQCSSSLVQVKLLASTAPLQLLSAACKHVHARAVHSSSFARTSWKQRFVSAFVRASAAAPPLRL